jgi:purine nucleoside phosphorylase
MVGMTAMPEAGLARELGIAYALCAIAVNHAAGRGPGDATIHAELERHSRLGMQRVSALLDLLIPDLLRAG